MKIAAGNTPRLKSVENGAAACTLIAGDLEAVFLPARGMLGASLHHRGAQILRRISDLQTAAAKRSTAGRHPVWCCEPVQRGANRCKW